MPTALEFVAEKKEKGEKKKKKSNTHTHTKKKKEKKACMGSIVHPTRYMGSVLMLKKGWFPWLSS